MDLRDPRRQALGEARHDRQGVAARSDDELVGGERPGAGRDREAALGPRRRALHGDAFADRRIDMAAEALEVRDFHLWLPLASRWSMVEFASFLRMQGAGVVASVAFSTDGDPPDAVRICLGGPIDRDACDTALALIADTLDHPQHPHATAM